MAKSAAPVILKALMTIILLFWVSLWVIKPTDVWTRAWRRAEHGATGTVFGYSAMDFAVVSFPVIILSILGLIHLNLQSKEQRRRKSSILSTCLSNPVVVNSSVGIVSLFEILAVLFFVLFLVWTFYAKISSDFHRLKPVKSMNLELWQLKYLRIAARFGLLAEACLALLLLPILRKLSLFRVIGIQMEISIRYHIWLGTLMISFAAFHGGSTLLIWGISHHIEDEVWKWQRKGRIYFAGEMTLVVGILMFLTSLPQIRRQRFQLFYYAHHLYLMLLVFFLFHVGDRHFFWTLPGVFLFGLDKFLRIIQSSSQTQILTAKVLNDKALEILLPKHPKLMYAPSSVLFMNVPSVSRFQWHPFSITSSCIASDRTLSVIIKREGWWTSCVFDRIQAKMCDQDSCRNKKEVVRIEGPYGPNSFDFHRFQRLVLVAGGIGVTPLLSIIQEVSSKDRKKKIHLVFIARSKEDISTLNPIFSLITRPVFYLKAKIFITRERGCSSNLQELISESLAQTRTAHFEPENRGHEVRETESSTQLAAVVLISTLVFFLCLISFNQFFFPVEKNKSPVMKLAASSLTMDFVVLSSFAISLTCGALLCLFLRWRKPSTGIPELQREEKTPPNWSESVADSVEENEVYYGERPDFAGILSEFEDQTEGKSEIGVVVCGPEPLKEAVARACRNKTGCLGLGSKSEGGLFTFHSLNFSL